LTSLPGDFQELKQLYATYGFTIVDVTAVNENPEYGGCDFSIDGKNIKFRAARITPTKTGLFVAIWKRDTNGSTIPFDASDTFDFLMISVREENRSGQFLFPKSVLTEKGVVSENGKSGKRGTRVYPPWAKDLNKQAEKTQQWQTKYFLDAASENPAIDLEKLLTHR
jgi:hypothetical protein